MHKENNINIMIIGGNHIGKGAEAMLLVVRDQLLNYFPDAQFWTVPINSEETIKLRDAGINVIHEKSVNKIIKGIQLAGAIIGLKSGIRKKEIQSGDTIENTFKVTKYVVDISGFVSSDQIGIKSARSRWIIYSHAANAGNKILFMPQSWGPFQNFWVRLFTRWTLNKASLICAREKISYDYLISSKCVKKSDVDWYQDIAFLFEVYNHEIIGRRLINKLGLQDSNLPLISFTPNMRIYERAGGKKDKNRYIKILSDIIHYFLTNTNHNIVLIPHEASHKRHNDPELCFLLMDIFRKPDRIAMLSGKESAQQVKAVIGMSEFLVASRYHSLVAALSMRTPVAVIGWSHKYDELMRVVDLNDCIVDPVRNVENDHNVETIIKAYKQRDMIRGRLKEKVPEIEKNVKNVFEKVADIINQQNILVKQNS